MATLRFDSKPSRDSDHLILGHAGETFRIRLKRVSGARRYTLRVRSSSGDVLLTMPTRGSARSAKEFAERNAGWIAARLKRLPTPVPFVDGATVPLRGTDHVIIHCPQARGTVWTRDAADGDAGPASLCVAGGAAHIGRRIHDFLVREARTDLEIAVARHTRALGLSARKVTVRDTTSRWGSCSSSGSLNFSWRLIFAPPYVLDYLAAHEVAHLVHMNHSAEFWTVTRKLAPHTDRAEAWLRAHGSGLHRFGMAPTPTG